MQGEKGETSERQEGTMKPQKGGRKNGIERDWKVKGVEGKNQEKIIAQIIQRPRRVGNIKTYKFEKKVRQASTEEADRRGKEKET